MAKLIKPLRKNIHKLYFEGYKIEDIFNAVFKEAIRQVKTEEEVWKCIQAIIRNANQSKYLPKEFDSKKYFDDAQYLKSLKPKEFELETSPFAKDILITYEKFDQIIDANQQLNFNNPPFDFLGKKNGTQYLIEYKGRFNQFGGIGKDQRRRQHRIIDKIESLKSALIQINFRDQEYKILYDSQIDDCYPDKEIPMDNIIKWIKSHL